MVAIILTPTGVAADQVYQNTEFKIYSGDQSLADSTYYYLKFYQTRIEQFLQWQLDTTVSIYIAETDDDFYSKVGGSFPDWGVGAADLENSTIVIKAPAMLQTGKSLRELVSHELAHVILFRAAGRHWLPRWLHEGFAMYISGEWQIGQDILVARSVWTGNLIPLQKLEILNSFKGVQANLAYTQSYLAVSSLLSKRDPSLFPDILELYRRTGDFFESWRIVSGREYRIWMNEWYSGTSKKYRMFLFLFDSEIFWIILSLLFIFLFIMKRIQNRRIRKRWEIEERLRPADESYKKYFDGYYDEENKT